MKKLHEKSCMLDCFMKACGLTHYDYAVAFVGHDGSERGFHSQELIDLALAVGYTVTEIQRHPLGTHPETRQPVEINWPLGVNHRFVKYLQKYKGVLMGTKLGRYHALYWDGETAHDPANGLCYNLLRDGELLTDYFYPYTFLIVEPNGRSN